MRLTVYALHYVGIICCVAVIPADPNCTTEWHRVNNTYTGQAAIHTSVSSLTECQKACEFDSRCIVVMWQKNRNFCWLDTVTNRQRYQHDHIGKQLYIYWDG